MEAWPHSVSKFFLSNLNFGWKGKNSSALRFQNLHLLTGHRRGEQVQINHPLDEVTDPTGGAGVLRLWETNVETSC